ncbi:MAG TPA: tonB-system energizer ExbB [Methylovirgula sp.]|nr:tonB-system energizer ExbB [Methylovirgula sp.]
MLVSAFRFENRSIRHALLAAVCLSGLCFAPLPTLAEDAAPAATAQATPAAPTAAPSVASPPAAVPATAPAATDAAPKLEDGGAPPATAAAPAASAPAANPGEGAPAAVPARLLPHDLSPWGMFLNADIIVKIVMVGLAFASVATWTIWLAKSLELFTARQRAQKQLAALATEETLSTSQAAFASNKGAVAQMVAAAAGELHRSNSLSVEGIKERAAALIARIEARAGREMNRGTAILGTIGATAPFVGLFGTVWGIMNSFIGISKTNTTNLAVVAPGIAEALLATAFGLVAAIPAVMIYNVFARSITGYRATLGDAAAEVMRHLSRDLDRATMESAEVNEDWRSVNRMRQSAE